MNEIKYPRGKLWTTKQIEDNLNSGIFSEYFNEEFAYLQNTVLLAENLLPTKLMQPVKCAPPINFQIFYISTINNEP